MRNRLLGSVELKGLEVNAGEFYEGVELQMNGAAAVDGEVSDGEGNSVAGALVEFRGRSPLDNSRWRADTSGTFLAGGLKPGRYQVRATRHKQISPWVSVQAKAMTTTSMDALVLQPGTLIDIEALVGGEPAGRVHARVHDENGLRTDSKVFRNGKGQLGPILPGSYTVSIKPVGDDQTETSQSISVTGEPSLKVTIELPE